MARIAVGQICSTASMNCNLKQCQTLVAKAVQAGAKALFLPEASDYIMSSPAESVALAQPVGSSTFVQGLQQSARLHKLPINVGIHEPSPNSSRIRNTLIWIDTAGEIVHRYQKVHLFDIDLSHNDPPGPVLKESKSTEPGNQIASPFNLSSASVAGAVSRNETVANFSSARMKEYSDPSTEAQTETDVNWMSIGSLICFDLRFSAISQSLRHHGANILLYPSAFTVPTGKAHWEVLLRARAVETQCWVIAAAQCGRHNSKRVSYGESLVVDPNGAVVGRLDRVEDMDTESQGSREPSLLVVDVNEDAVANVRRGIPLQDLMRPDVYGDNL